MGLVVSLVLLAVTLAAAIARPFGLPEAVVAVPAAVVCVAGPLSRRAAGEEIEALAPTLGFLAAVLILGRLCALEGLFRWAGAVLSRAAGPRPRSLLAWVLLLGTAVTTVLSLDATVVLFTPVVLAAAVRAGVPSRPHLHATVHLSNAASLLLPVSNLTNLLAYEATGLSFARFAVLMAMPLIVVLVVEYVGTRLVFASELTGAGVDTRGGRDDHPRDPAPEPVPWLALAVIAATLAGLVASSPLDLAPGWVAGAGAALLGVKRCARDGLVAGDVARWAEPAFLLFVAGLAIVVRTAADQGLGDLVDGPVDQPGTLPGLLAIALVGAVTANVLNNLPAVLLLLPLVAPDGAGPVLALLLGVNIGPNLTYVGSLASMLWLKVARREGAQVDLATFTRHGLATVPVALVGATTALWAGLRLIGA